MFISKVNWNLVWVYIENVKTGLVIDVQGNVKANGTHVWPHILNYSKAQMFQFSEHFIPERYGEDARYIMYLLKAIDCGNTPPNATQEACHKLTSPIIQGGENGTSLTFQIN